MAIGMPPNVHSSMEALTEVLLGARLVPGAGTEAPALKGTTLSPPPWGQPVTEVCIGCHGNQAILEARVLVQLLLHEAVQ